MTLLDNVPRIRPSKKRYRVSDAPPADLRGKPRADRVFTVAGKLIERVYIARIERTDYDRADAGHNPNSAMQLVLRDRVVVASDENVVQLSFGKADGSDVPPWQPGCHLDFHLPSGKRRQYSICGDPTDRSVYTIAVRRIADGGGGSIEMHELEAGSQVTVRGPRNGFPLIGTGSALFIAGGIGITPIIAMVRTARELGMDWRFVYSGRSRESMPFLDEIESWDPYRVFVRPDDEYGIPTASELLSMAPEGGAVYMCGPTPMLDAVRREFDETPSAALHYERFSAPTVEGGTPFEVQLVSSGEVLEVPADETALAVIRRQMPTVGYSCQQGFCGTCRVKVLHGQPEHRENRLTAEEKQNEMLICVSRADGGRLVLDL
ncbi:oxidoreductase [Antrihabitans sp. YC3-6]|uniref:Oxidoreductase n=1 Tax=Antrihabitans stalagmiti TaxID=2799499 RepID=A0A934U6H9_9NOCA|nr:PDR/VanB family oxidoreductase [Antrihabitans stalagmiti]MBJ8342554.1 oxidoreductase [Antrihabitans stalagmiti]